MSDLQRLHTDFLEELEIGQGRSPKTVENYDHYLKRFYEQQKISSISDVSLDAVRGFRRFLNDQARVSLVTQNYHIIAIRQLLKYLARRDIPALAAEKLGLAKLPERDIDVLYPEEVEALLQAPDLYEEKLRQKEYSTQAEHELKRDRAILHTLFSTGLRISELVGLDRDDIRRHGNEIPVRGKGNKVRVVFLSQDARDIIAVYVAVRQDTDPALFIRHKKGLDEATPSLRLTPRSIQRLIKRYAALAGLTKNITPHTLRHSFATDLLSNGADVRQVQQLLGHASITTTQVYTHLTDAHLREVHQRFHRKRLAPPA